ncbi:MAG: LPXTG cell wall anchor domain-containing protein [Bifidobacteriaceae bacterium]|nr:LPXTG cell wall anchor domain-containing protein [Bifidobacteriaceae bacterium]
MSKQHTHNRLLSAIGVLLILIAMLAVPPPPTAAASESHHRPGFEGVTKLLNWTAIKSVRLDSTFYAYAKAGEVIHATSLAAFKYPWGAPNPDKANLPDVPRVRVRIIDPAGNTIGTCTAVGAGDECSTTATAASTAVFKVVWDAPGLVENGAQIYLRQDLWVTANAVDKIGRVFGTSIHVEQNGSWQRFDPEIFGERGTISTATVYVLGDDGTLLKVDLAEYMGVSSAFYADALGVYETATCLPINRSVSDFGVYTAPLYSQGDLAKNGCGRSFLLFPDQPSTDLPEALTAKDGWDGPIYPRYQMPTQPEIGLVTAASPVNPNRPYALTAALDLARFKGEYEVAVDVNGDGDTSDPVDVVERYERAAPDQPAVWTWDGVDGRGQAVPGSGPQPVMTVRLIKGNQYHLVLHDVEILAGGARIQQLAGYLVSKNGGEAAWPRVHWDDTDVAAHRSDPNDWRTTLTTEPKLLATPPEGIAQTGAFVHGWREGDTPAWGDWADISLDVWNDLSGDASLSASRSLAARHLDITAKTGRLGTPSEGARRIAYEVTAKNTGNTAFTSGSPAEIVDLLPAHMTDWRMDGVEFDSGTTSIGMRTVIADGKLTWSSPLKSGETVRIRYSGAVEPGFTPNRVNTAGSGTCPELTQDGTQVIVSSCDDDPATATVPLPGLEVAKRVATDGLHKAGHTAAYTVTLTNIGKAAYTAADPARVVDDLSGVLDDSVLDVSSIEPAEAKWDALRQTISWAGPLAVGRSQDITYQVVYAPGLSDLSLDNTASINAVDAIDQTPGLRAETSTPGSDLHVSKAASVDQAKAGDQVAYTVTLDNSRGKVAAPVAWTDDLSGVLDDASLVGEPAVTGRGVTVSRQDLAFEFSGQVGPGEKVTIRYALTVTQSGGDRLLRNTLLGECDGGQCPPPEECRPDDPLTTCTPVVGYEVSKEAILPEPGRAPWPGETVTYQLMFRNVGSLPIEIEERDDLSGVLDDATLGQVDLTAAEGLTARFEDGHLVVTGSLGVDTTAVISYQVLVLPFEERGDSVLINRVMPSGVITTTEISELRLLKTARPAVAKPGDEVSYEIEIESVGSAPAELDYIDNLSWAADDARLIDEPTSDNEVIGIDHEPGVNAFGLEGELTPGDEATITYQMKVFEAEDGDDVMTNVVAMSALWLEPAGLGAVPEERPDCAGLPSGTCTTTPVVRPSVLKTLPMTGSNAVWPVALGMGLVSGGLCLWLMARRRPKRS